MISKEFSIRQLKSKKKKEKSLITTLITKINQKKNHKEMLCLYEVIDAFTSL